MSGLFEAAKKYICLERPISNFCPRLLFNIGKNCALKLYMCNLEHQNFSGIDPISKAPFFLSITVEEEIDDNRLLRTILWTAQVTFLESYKLR